MGYEIIAVDGVKINKTTKKFPVEVSTEPHELSGIEHTGILAESQLPDSVMLESEHALDPHTMTIDGRNVSEDGTKLDTIQSGAQVNNLSDQQAQSLTSGAQSSWHHHDDWYYRKTEISSSGGSSIHWDNLTNVPTEFIPSSHNHNDLYYTESEVDAKIAAVESFGILGGVDTFADLPTSNTNGDIYIVRTTVAENLEGFYKWDGSVWVFLARNTGSEIHDHDDRYYTQTEIDNNYYTKVDIDNIYAEAQIDELTSGENTVLHHHDSRYYTESEIDQFLNTKSDTSHIHDNRYYTHTQINDKISAINYTLLSSQDANTNITPQELEELTNGSNVDHLHTHENLGGNIDGKGLDDAYDNHSAYQAGVGRTINVDAGPVTLNSSGGFAPLKLNPTGAAPTQWLGGGELTVYDNELFLYDASRSKWLSISQSTFLFNKNKDNDYGYMKLGDTTTNSTNGAVFPWPVTIVGVSASCKGSDECKDDDAPTASFDICKNGYTQQSIYWGGQITNSWSNINIDIDLGDVVQVYGNKDGDRPDRPLVTLFFKRRIS